MWCKSNFSTTHPPKGILTNICILPGIEVRRISALRFCLLAYRSDMCRKRVLSRRRWCRHHQCRRCDGACCRRRRYATWWSSAWSTSVSRKFRVRWKEWVYTARSMVWVTEQHCAHAEYRRWINGCQFRWSAWREREKTKHLAQLNSKYC